MGTWVNETVCPLRIQRTVTMLYTTNIHCPTLGINIALRLVPDGGTFQNTEVTEDSLFQIPIGKNVILKLSSMEYLLVRENGEVFICSGNPNEPSPCHVNGLLITRLKPDKNFKKEEIVMGGNDNNAKRYVKSSLHSNSQVENDHDYSKQEELGTGSSSETCVAPGIQNNKIMNEETDLHSESIFTERDLNNKNLHKDNETQRNDVYVGDISGNFCESQIDSKNSNRVKKKLCENSSGLLWLEGCKTHLKKKSSDKSKVGEKLVKEKAPVKKKAPMFTCEVCDAELFSKRAFSKHVKEHAFYKPFKCEDCDKTFHHHKGLYAHWALTHNTKPRVHLCNICGKPFKTFAKLQIHIRRHTGEKPFQCRYCEKTFVSKDSTITHEASVHIEKKFLCDTCGKAFAIKSFLNLHVKNKCSSGQGSKNNAFGKKRKVVTLLEGAITVSKGCYQCTVCEGKYFSKTLINRHIKLHQSIFECQICLKHFPSKTTRKEHVQSDHEQDRKFHCLICGMKFFSNKNLQKHQLKHSLTKEHNCPECGNTFRYKENLDAHLRQFHEYRHPLFSK